MAELDPIQAPGLPASPEGYAPPRVEITLSADELEREALYAGKDDQSADL